MAPQSATTQARNANATQAPTGAKPATRPAATQTQDPIVWGAFRGDFVTVHADEDGRDRLYYVLRRGPHNGKPKEVLSVAVRTDDVPGFIRLQKEAFKRARVGTQRPQAPKGEECSGCGEDLEMHYHKPECKVANGTT